VATFCVVMTEMALLPSGTMDLRCLRSKAVGHDWPSNTARPVTRKGPPEDTSTRVRPVDIFHDRRRSLIIPFAIYPHNPILRDSEKSERFPTRLTTFDPHSRENV
jgi:hypothetical protein